MFPAHGHARLRVRRLHRARWHAGVLEPVDEPALPRSLPHPHAFDPGRWDPARGEDQAKGKYMVGFGGGPRLCLGRNFAQMQLRILVTTLVRRFHIEPDATRPFTIQGLPTHHPVDSFVHFRPLLAYQERGGRARAALAGARQRASRPTRRR
jgi:hypothetical protein